MSKLFSTALAFPATLSIHVTETIMEIVIIAQIMTPLVGGSIPFVGINFVMSIQLSTASVIEHDCHRVAP